MRNATDVERKVIEKQVSNYLWMENLQTIIGVIVFFIIGFGLVFAQYVDGSLFISNIVMNITFGLFFIFVGFVLILEFRRTFTYSKMLKTGTYTIEDCVSRNVDMRMNRAKKEVELVCKYEDKDGKLSEKDYPIISNSKVLCVSDCENKECTYIKFTDNFGFIMINKN